MACMRGVRDVRVLGAIGVVELEDNQDVSKMCASLLEAGVWVRPFRSVVYLTPAFTIATEELDVLTNAIVNVVQAQPGADSGG